MDISGIFQKVRDAIQHTPTQEVQSGLIKEDHRVVGVSYCMDSIQALATCNPDWKCTAAQLKEKNLLGRKVYRYTYVNKPVKLIPEKNPHDKNAIMVMIAGEKVGYIARTENVALRKILDKKEIRYITAFIGGGQYKVVAGNGDIDRLTEDISINIRVAYK